MTLPALILGFVLSTLLGAAFHLWKGGSAGRLLLYLVLGWAGFWIGHWIANLQDWTFGRMGPLNLGSGILVSLAILFLGHWLSLVKVQPK